MAVRFKKHSTDSFFGHFLYEQIIPKDHFLIKAKQIIDWDRFTDKCLRYYKGSAEIGRARYNPSVLLRILFLSYLYNISERQIEERVDLVAMLGIKIYPAEDLKSRRIVCRLNLKKVVGEREQNDFAKVMFGGAEVSIGRTFSTTFAIIS